MYMIRTASTKSAPIASLRFLLKMEKSKGEPDPFKFGFPDATPDSTLIFSKTSSSPSKMKKKNKNYN